MAELTHIQGDALPAGTLSSLSFLGPKAGAETFHVPGTTADSMFAGLTFTTGVVGCLTGGWVLDVLGCSIAQALGLCAICSAFGYATGSRRGLIPFETRCRLA